MNLYLSRLDKMRVESFEVNSVQEIYREFSEKGFLQRGCMSRTEITQIKLAVVQY